LQIDFVDLAKNAELFWRYSLGIFIIYIAKKYKLQYNKHELFKKINVIHSLIHSLGDDYV